MTISLNGGIKSMAEVQSHLQYVDGVMLGREAYQNPYLMMSVDEQVFGDTSRPSLSRHQVVQQMVPYIEAELASGNQLSHITRHMLGLFQGVVGARSWPRHLSENAGKRGADIRVLLDALALVPDNPAPMPEL